MPKTKNPHAPERRVALYLFTQWLSEEPHEYVTRAVAAAYVDGGFARWHCGSRAIKLTSLRKPQTRFHDQSSTMHGCVTERALAGSVRDAALVQEWRYQPPKGTVHAETATRAA